jgi:hypothetical protein
MYGIFPALHAIPSIRVRSIGTKSRSLRRIYPSNCPYAEIDILDKPMVHELFWSEEEESNVVGAHGLLTNEDGVHLGIFPCRKKCNNTSNEVAPIFKAVFATVVNQSDFTYAGTLKLETE